MDPLDHLTIRTVELATYARNAFAAGSSELAYEYLDELYDLLDDKIAGRTPQECADGDP